jgi:hypothetical protein
MKNFILFSICVVSYILTCAQETQPRRLVHGGDDCDTKNLGNGACNDVLSGCTKTYKKCMSGQPSERNYLCNAGQGAVVCLSNRNAACVGINEDKLSTAVCDTPEAEEEPIDP